MATNESGLVGEIRRAVQKRWPTAYTLKVHGGPYQEAGVPDLLICVAGRLFGIEVKYPQPGESEEHARRRETLIQGAHLFRIRRAGGTAGTVVSVEEALALIASGLAMGDT